MSFRRALLLSAFMFCSSPALAASDQDTAYDARGQIVQDKWGGCVRTKWQQDSDACAPEPAPAPAPVAAPEPAPAPEPVPVISQEERTIYFDFDKAALTPESLDKLAALTTIINSSKRIIGVSIAGHTDEFGASDYNQTLSEKRARVVEAYLDQNSRLDATIANVRGLGRSQPVSDCSNVKGREAKITCMAMDRRVEVQLELEQ